MPLSLHRAGALTGLLAAALLASAAPAAAGSPFRIVHPMGTACIEINTPPAGTALTVILDRASKPDITRTGVSAVDGVDVCFGTRPAKNDIVRIKRDSTTLRTVTIPWLTGTLNLATDTFGWRFPAGGTLYSSAVFDYRAGTFHEGSGWDYLVSDPDDDGRVGFTKDASAAYDLRGGDQTDLYWADAADNLFHAFATKPSVVVGASTAKGSVSGTGKPGTKVTIRAYDGATLKGTAKAMANGADGTFTAILRNAAGDAVAIKPGWTLVHSGAAPGAPRLKVLAKDFHPSTAGDGTVKATCFKDAEYQILDQSGTFVVAGSESTGSMEIDNVSNLVGLAGQTVRLFCDNAQGNGQVFRATVVETPVLP